MKKDHLHNFHFPINSEMANFEGKHKMSKFDFKIHFLKLKFILDV